MEFVPSQNDIANRIIAESGPPKDGEPLFHFFPDPGVVRGACLEAVGYLPAADYRVLGYVMPDGRHVTLVLHRFSSTCDADLIALGSPGLLRRQVRLAFLSWAFSAVGVARVTARVRSGAWRHQEFLRRLGFVHEGTCRSFFDDGSDASVWGLTRADALASVGRGPAPAPPPSNRKLN